MHTVNYLVFLFFKFLIILSGLLVIGSANPVHSILFLIVVFCAASGILLLLEVEFLALVILVVYVGAIAVLFLFVVMMLNIRIEQFSEKFLTYFPISGLIGVLFVVEVSVIFYNIFSKMPYGASSNYLSWLSAAFSSSSVEALGQFMYTYAFCFFEIAGLILLVAMVGSILLTLHQVKNVKSQNVYQQVKRRPEQQVYLVENSTFLSKIYNIW